MPTPTERRIIQERRARVKGYVLAAVLEDLLETEVRHDDDLDYQFSDMLNRARELPREAGVFSPSMLAGCMRQAFFAKSGVEKHKAASPQTNGYFMHGDAIHKKWQFALWKAHRKGLLELPSVPAETPELDFYGDGTRPAVEVRVVSASGDFAGTIDAIVKIGKRYYIVDFKGINLVDFMRSLKRGPEPKYKVQIVGYAMIVNGSELPFVVKQAIIVHECKAGPVSGAGSPLALNEAVVDVDDFKKEVRKRLVSLRSFVEKEQTPPPACVSTQHMAFQECPFNRFCRSEVKEIEQQRKEEKAAQARKRDWQVHRPRR